MARTCNRTRAVVHHGADGTLCHSTHYVVYCIIGRMGLWTITRMIQCMITRLMLCIMAGIEMVYHSTHHIVCTQARR